MRRVKKRIPRMPDQYTPKPFHCEVESRDGTAYVRPTGDLDMSTVPALEEQIKACVDGGGRRVVIDLRGLTFMDSTGLTLVTRWNNESRRDGFELALIPGHQRVQRLFELTSMTAYFTFVSG